MTEQELTLIIGKLSGQMEIVIKNQAEMFLRLHELPCNEHIETIKDNKQCIETLNKWKNNIEGISSSEKLESYKGFISFKYAAILVILTNFVTLILSIISRVWIP